MEKNDLQGIIKDNIRVNALLNSNVQELIDECKSLKDEVKTEFKPLEETAKRNFNEIVKEIKNNASSSEEKLKAFKDSIEQNLEKSSMERKNSIISAITDSKLNAESQFEISNNLNTKLFSEQKENINKGFEDINEDIQNVKNTIDKTLKKENENTKEIKTIKIIAISSLIVNILLFFIVVFIYIKK